ncbi:MAG: hypothetical protein ACRYE8_03095 [Janthinobacterium lividum]
MSSRGLSTGSSIKRVKLSFFYLYSLLFYWIPWSSHGMTMKIINSKSLPHSPL